MDGKQWNFEFENYFKEEFLQSPSDTPPLSNGDQNTGHVICFWKAFIKCFFQKHTTCTPFYGDWKVLVIIIRGNWNFLVGSCSLTLQRSKIFYCCKFVARIFSCHKIGDWNPFLVAFCNGGNMNVNKYFPTFVMIHATNMSDAKWPCHINFDNPKSNDLVNLSNLGSTLLWITSDNQLFFYKKVWFPIIHHYLCQCQI